MSEDELLDNVLDLVGVLGYLVHHDRPAAGSRGEWSTAIQGDAGFPDLVLGHPQTGALFFVELKREGKNPTPDQGLWLETFAIRHPDDALIVQVWRPRDWLSGKIERILRFQARGRTLRPIA